MYKIKNVIGRSAHLVAAVSLLAGVVASALPSATTYADALNPLNERSLMLSSSSPGYHYLDGSGNSTYAAPGTGNNGQKTGETYSFKVSTDSTGSGPDIKGFTFQYCTTPAGECTIPGNVDTASPDLTTTSNLDIVYGSPVEASYDGGTSTFTKNQFAVFLDLDDNGKPDPATELQTGWTMDTARVVDHPEVNDTGGIGTEKNFIVLANTTGIAPAAGDRVIIQFYANDTQYITNPGSGAFFVKLNDYNSADYKGTDTKWLNDVGNAADGDMLPENGYAYTDTANSGHVVDGGVTVANVMNDSIWIQTKVLETMYFSVGTENPDTVVDGTAGNHGTCDPITKNDPISMGDSTAEFSLAVAQTYEARTYWRLSSNSSNGATVYYSGNTLANTNGDKIDPIGGNKVGTVGYTPTYNAAKSKAGGEQFGLAIDTRAYGTIGAPYTEGGVDTSDAPADGFSTNTIAPLVAQADSGNDMDYSGGGGTVLNDGTGTATFAFDDDSLTDPKPLASEGTDIIHCATARMRYVANIAPDTPAGVYTSKINYIASPQY